MRRSVIFLFASVIILGSAGIAGAALITYDYNNLISGDLTPRDSPFITATFDDKDVPGAVEMKLEAINLLNHEIVQYVYFNVDPDLVKSGLNISYLDGVRAQGAEIGSFLTSNGAVYNLRLEFKTSNQNRLFGADSISTYLFEADSLAAESFNILNEKNEFYASVATIIGSRAEVGAKDNLPLPESATMFLLGFGLIMVAGFGRNKIIKKK